MIRRLLANILPPVIASLVILTGAFFYFRYLPKPDLSDKGEATWCQDIPQFSQYPAAEIFGQTPSVINWNTNTLALEMSKEILAATPSGANFAGQYLLVETSCGLDCQKHAVVDLRDGRIASYGLTSITGVRYQKDSRLLLVNPTPSATKHTLYYDFQGSLHYVCETKL